MKKLKQQLEDEKEKSSLAEKYSTPRHHEKLTNGPDHSVLDAQSTFLIHFIVEVGMGGG